MDASNIIFGVFGITLPWTEPQSPGPFVNTLTAWAYMCIYFGAVMHIFVDARVFVCLYMRCIYA